MSVRVCGYCQSNKFKTVKTYKHLWHACLSCECIIREKRGSYAAEWVPTILLRAQKMPFFRSRIARLEQIFRPLGPLEDLQERYDHYLEPGAQPRSAKGTKWEGQLDALKGELAPYGAKLEGKRILDISGEPGFFAMEVSQICERIVTTAYSQVAADRMRELTGLETACFDFQNDNIGAVVQGPFDLVLARYAINFCSDLGRFIAQLKPILSPGALIFFSYTTPSLGTCLRWQFDDYTYLTLYDPDEMSKIMEEQGFLRIGHFHQGSYHFLLGRTGPLNLLHRLFQFRNCTFPNQDVLQHGVASIFQMK